MKDVYPEETKIAVRSDFKNGECVASLSKKYGVSRSTIYFWIKQYEELSAYKYAKKIGVTQKDYSDLLDMR